MTTYPRSSFFGSRGLVISFLLVLMAAFVEAAEPSAAAGAMHLLKTKCVSCHNEEKTKGGLVMTSRGALLQGGENGAAIVVGVPEESAMIASLAADADPHMPPKKQLPAKQIEVLRQWVRDGATWDAAALAQRPSAPRLVTLATLPSTYQPVFAMALSPDGKRLAVGCGNEVVMCEVGEKSVAVLARASAHSDAVQALAWSPDGARLATGAFRRLVIWNAATLTPDHEISDELSDRLTTLRFLPDGRLVIADGRVVEEGTVRILDAANRTMVASWAAHADVIYDLVVSADGQLLATAGGDKLVKIWELATQKELARIEGHAAQVLGLAFNPDATQLVSAGADQQLKVWDVKTKDRLMTLGKHSAALNGVAWTAQGPAIFAITDAGGLLRYTAFKNHSGAEGSDSANEQKLSGVDNALYCVVASADGERIFAGSHDGRVLAWDKDGKLVTKLNVNEARATGVVAK